MNDELVKRMGETTACTVAGLNERIAALEKERDTMAAENRRLKALTLHDADGRLMTQGALNALFSQYHAAGDVLGEVIALRNGSPAAGDELVAPPRHAASRAMWETVKERDAALADNAALLRRSFNLCAGCSGSKTTPVLDADCYEIGRQPCTACEDIRVPHPGAALLEEHRKALVRARNEGLDLLAKRLIERRDQMQGRVAADGRRRGLEEAASIARSMKEPE